MPSPFPGMDPYLEHPTVFPGLHDRFVSYLSEHFDNLEDFFVYSFTLRDGLPEIAIPLLPGDGSVVTDLQQVFQRCYETGPYTRRIRYRDSQPVPPLPEQFQSWAGKLVAELPQ